MNVIEFLGLRFVDMRFDEALAAIQTRADSPFRYVVTPNVDHIVRLSESRDPEIAAAYTEADLCFCDSQVLRRLAGLFGIQLNTVTGSDLLLRLIPDLIRPGESINLVGGDAELVERLTAILPTTRIAAHFPPMGMLRKPEAMAAAQQFIETHPASYTLLCCGSPQQELIAHRVKRGGVVGGTALCIGAAVEFLVERKQRAPAAMRHMGLEWLHRLVSEPKRLWRRYLLRGPMVVPIVLRWWFMRHPRTK